MNFSYFEANVTLFCNKVLSNIWVFDVACLSSIFWNTLFIPKYGFFDKKVANFLQGFVILNFVGGNEKSKVTFLWVKYVL